MFIAKAILIFIHVLTSILLVTVILLQASKGGGLSGAFGGQTPTMLFGPRNTASALATITKYLAGAFLVISLVISLMTGGGRMESVTQKVLQTSPAGSLPPVEALDFSTAPAGAEQAPAGQPAETEGK